MITFTEKHLETLKGLFLELGFSGATLPGKFGSNSYNVMDLLHNSSITTLQGLHVQLKKDISSLGDTDDWSGDSRIQTRVENLTKWKEFIHLIIGYKKSQAEQEELADAKKKEMAKQLALLSKAKEGKELEEISKMSLEELNSKISELSK